MSSHGLPSMPQYCTATSFTTHARQAQQALLGTYPRARQALAIPACVCAVCTAQVLACGSHTVEHTKVTQLAASSARLHFNAAGIPSTTSTRGQLGVPSPPVHMSSCKPSCTQPHSNSQYAAPISIQHQSALS